MSEITNISMPFQAGNTYTLYIPTTLQNNGGLSPQTGEVKINDNTRTLINGFCLESEESGTIVKAHTDKVAVDYKQILPASNVIWFYAYTGERIRMAATPMIVHSHATVSQGGPAYGTYFSYVDDSTQEGSDEGV